MSFISSFRFSQTILPKFANVATIPRSKVIIRTTIGFFLVLLAYSIWNNKLKTQTVIPVEPFVVRAKRQANQWSALPNLQQLDWPIAEVAQYPSGRRFPNGTVKPLPPALSPVVSKAQLKLTKHLLKTFSDLMFQHGMGDRFMLNGGTLVGSFQHHDIVPWDDDVDVLADVNVRPSIQRILQQLTPEYQVTIQGVRDKLYTKFLSQQDDELDRPLSRKASRFPWGWPYLDIGYFRENDTHLWDISTSPRPTRGILKKIIFPLVFRPLGKHWYPAPFDTLSYMRRVYGKSGGCAVFGYSHILEGRGPSGRTSCWSLGRRYAFVQRTLADPEKFIIADPQWARTMVVVEESLVYRTNRAPLVLHTIQIPSLVGSTEVNTYSFVDAS
ncbi:Lipopolysaccharide choline [Fasciola hepatica]|uniref:Lipopolysaccharide choline n=1 Tax=Fasciola hepatica TaxID=6192 RepID=A0A4E0QWI4_FASHE|nr:Lipopolysaccharide choline [Fasciola hepatica]